MWKISIYAKSNEMKDLLSLNAHQYKLDIIEYKQRTIWCYNLRFHDGMTKWIEVFY